MLLASGLTAAFLIAGLSAYRWLRGDRGGDVTAALRTGVVAAALLIPVQIFVGDLHGLNTLEHQPAKIAAMEGIWETEKRRAAAAVRPARRDRRAATDFEIADSRRCASLILTHDWNGELKGLNEFAGTIRRWRRCSGVPRHGRRRAC